MARKTIRYTVQDEGRDKDKVFVLTEMPSSKAEEWAMRAFLALSRSGQDVPDEVSSMGMAGIAILGFKMLAGVQWEEAKPLMDTMMECVQYLPDPKHPARVRPLWEEDIEEVRTRVLLRREVFNLHTGFFDTAAPSTSEASEGVA